MSDGFGWTESCHGLAVKTDGAAVLANNTAGDLDQRGLARAVLADEAQHRAGLRIEGDIDDGARRAEVLVDGLE